MADQLERTHALAGRLALLETLPDGFDVDVDPYLTMTDLRFQPGGPAAEPVTAVLGVTPPTTPNTWLRGDAGGGGNSVIWLGPDEWLVVGELGQIQTQETALRGAVVPFGGAAVDVSGQRLLLRLRGRHLRDILAKGCAVDLHPSAFPPGSSSQTTIGLAGVVLLAGDDPAELTVLVRPSFAGYLVDWLLDAAVEFEA